MHVPYPRRRPWLVLLAALAIPSSSLAQTVPFTPAPVTACLDKAQTAPAREACVGAGAAACKATTAKANGGRAQVGDIAACMAAETEWWSRRIDTALDGLRAKADTIDAVIDATKPGGFRLSTDLAAMQDAWVDWREKTCAFEAMLRRGTPYTSTAAASCMMKLTGRQALFLETALAYRTVQEEAAED